MATGKLSATYTGPGENKDMSLDLPAIPKPDSDVDAKTAYLTALRTRIGQLQDNINLFLTQKMNEDNAASAVLAADAKDRARLQKEQREADMYGEEVVDEE